MSLGAQTLSNDVYRAIATLRLMIVASVERCIQLIR